MKRLQLFLCWLFWRISRDKAEAIIKAVIHAALDWDMPPSDIENIMDEYLRMSEFVTRKVAEGEIVVF